MVVAPGPSKLLEGARYRDIGQCCAILCDIFRYLAMNRELSKILAKAGLPAVWCDTHGTRKPSICMLD